MDESQDRFTKIYRNREWGAQWESASGSGSTLKQAQVLLDNLPRVLKKLGIRSLVDAPCGDMNWMKHLEYDFHFFVGIDIVPDIIADLRKKEFPPNYFFQTGNIVTDLLPKADAVFCRDCLVHLPFDAALKALTLWTRSGFKYALITTYTARELNRDIKTGWRPLNMEAPPFNLGEPILLVPDRPKIPHDRWFDKSIGVWAL